MESGFYFGLNSVASVIWGMMEGGIQFSVLVEKLMEQFDVDRATCESDTRELIDQLLEKKIIRVVE
jgi:hypothetical protein